MKRIGVLFIAVVLTALLAPSCPAESGSAGFVHILYTTNILGRIDETVDEDGDVVGGLLRLGYAVQVTRAQVGQVLLLDAGNAIGPGPLVSSSRGLDQIRVMNEIGYTAMALGEMEFMYGSDALAACIREAEFPLVSANVLDADTGATFTHPYIVRDMPGGVRVGITGVTDPNIPLVAYGCPGLRIEQPLKTLRTVVAALRQQNDCDLVVVLSNLTPESNQAITQMVEDVDIVIGGDIRTTSPARVHHWIPQDMEKGVCAFYSTCYATALEKVDVRVEAADLAHTMTGADFESLHLDAQSYARQLVVEKMPALAALIDEILARVKAEQDTVIGEIRAGQSITVMDLTLLLMQLKSNTEFVLCDRGLFGWLRTDVLLQDRVTERTVCEGIPYEDELVVIEMKGSQLLDLIRYYQAQRELPNDVVYSSGFDPVKKKVNGNAIRRNEKYLVGVNSYIAAGGAGCRMCQQARRIKDTGIRIRELVVSYLRRTQAQGLQVDVARLRARTDRLHWKYKIGLSGKADFLSKNGAADAYRNVREFSRSERYHWVIEPVLQLEGRSLTDRFCFKMKPAYGRTTTFPKGKEPYEEILENSLNAEMEYRRLAGDRYYWAGSVQLRDLELVAETDESRKGSVLGSVGLHREFSRDLEGSVGLRAQKRLFSSDIDYGFYLGALYERQREDSKFEVNADLFYIVDAIDDVSSYPEGKTPTPGDYVMRIQGAATFPVVSGLSLKLEPLVYYESNMGEIAWALSGFVAIDLAWGRLP